LRLRKGRAIICELFGGVVFLWFLVAADEEDGAGGRPRMFQQIVWVGEAGDLKSIDVSTLELW